MPRPPTFPPPDEPATPPQNSGPAAPRPSPPGPMSPGSSWLHNHAYRRHRSAHRAFRQSADAKLTVPTLGRRLLVWGGHPAITPMIWAAANDMGVDYGAWVHLYQSLL